jgi:hypothetical protein
MAGINLQLDAAVLEPIIRKVVAETITQMEAERAKLGDRLAYSEPEAARLLGLREHQLRDCAKKAWERRMRCKDTARNLS